MISSPLAGLDAPSGIRIIGAVLQVLWLAEDPGGGRAARNHSEAGNSEEEARPGQEVGTVALVHILSQQLSDFLEKKGRRFELEDEITELRLQIAMKQAELARDMSRLDTEFRPASVYKQMDEQDLTRLCFEKYEEECRRDEEAAPPVRVITGDCAYQVRQRSEGIPHV